MPKLPVYRGGPDLGFAFVAVDRRACSIASAFTLRRFASPARGNDCVRVRPLQPRTLGAFNTGPTAKIADLLSAFNSTVALAADARELAVHDLHSFIG